MIGAPQTDLFPAAPAKTKRSRIVGDRGQGTERRRVEGYQLHRSLRRSRRFRRTRRLRRGDAARHAVWDTASTRRRRHLPDSRGLPRGPTEAAQPRHRPGPRRPTAKRPDARQERPLQYQSCRGRRAQGTACRGSTMGRRWTAPFGRSTACASRRAPRTPWRATCPAATSRRPCSANGWKSRRRSSCSTIPPAGSMSAAKREIYGLIRRISADGRIVLFSSTELPELIGLCDRIIVLYRGADRRRDQGRRDQRTRSASRGQHRRNPAGGASNEIAKRSDPRGGFRMKKETHDPSSLHDALEARQTCRIQAFS